MKKAIIIGATSGIGKELAVLLSNDGYELALTGRRSHLLQELQSSLPTKTLIEYMDIKDIEQTKITMQKILDEMKDTELIILSSGTGFINENLDWALEKETIDTNVLGITALLALSFSYFQNRGSGHLCAISSLAAIRGSSQAPAYNASKAFLTNYLEGLYCKAKKLNNYIIITEIKPGLVDTDMAKGEGLFWVADVHKAAQQIYNAIRRKKRVIVVTKRWRIVSMLLKILPINLYKKIA